MTPVAIGGTAAVTAAALGFAGWALAGPAGLLAAGSSVAISGLLAIWLVRVAPEPRPPRSGGGPVVPFTDAPYARYRKLRGDLSWGQVSARNFDHTTRRHLERITAALLMDRRGVDPGATPEAARDLLGADLWALADPSRPRSDDFDAPAPPLDDVARLVRGLEEL